MDQRSRSENFIRLRQKITKLDTPRALELSTEI